MKALVFILPFLLGCVDQGAVPTEGIPAKPVIAELVPFQAYHSQVVRIVGSGFAPNLHDNEVWISGIWAYVDSGSTSQLWIRVPYPASTGTVALRTPIDSVVGPLFILLSCFPSEVCMLPYLGSPITEDQSLEYNPITGHVSPWTGRISGDTVELIQDYGEGDDTHMTKILRFRGLAAGPTPQFLSGFVIRQEIHGTYPDTAKGIIAIQAWDPSGVVAGKVSMPYYDHFLGTYDSRWRDFVFWYDFH